MNYKHIFWFSLLKNNLLSIVTIPISIAVLFASAQIIIPFEPVPFTLQTSVVILLGVVLGARLSSIAVCSYLALGFLGLPLFSHLSSGLSWAILPKLGYLLGFIPACYLSAHLSQTQRIRSLFSAFTISCIADIPIFLCGFVMLAWFLQSYQAAFYTGVLLFIPSEIIKLFFTACIILSIKRK